MPTMICRAPTLNGKPKAIRNQAAVEAMPGITDVALVPSGVAVRGETFGQCIDAVRALDVSWIDGTVAGQSDATVLEGAPGRGGAARGAEARSARQDRRRGLHVLVPQQQLPGAQLRDRRRAHGRRRGVGRLQEPDHRCRGDRDDARHGPDRGEVPRHRGRRLVRPQAVLRRGHRGGPVLEGVRQAGAADVAPHRRLPGRPDPPDGHDADPGVVRRGRGADLRAAAHQRQDRLRARPRRDHHRDGRQAPGRRHRLLPDDLRADPGGALQLRRHQPAAQRGRPGLQHEQHAQHLLTRRGGRPRARRGPAGQEARQGPLPVPARVHQERPGPRGARQGRAGGQLGPLDAGRYGAGHRAPQGVQGRERRPRRDRLPPRRPSTGRSATGSPARASPRS